MTNKKLRKGHNYDVIKKQFQKWADLVGRIMAPSFFYLALFGLCVSLVRDWEKDKDATPSTLGVKDILHSHLRRSRLWQRV